MQIEHEASMLHVHVVMQHKGVSIVIHLLKKYNTAILDREKCYEIMNNFFL